MAKQASKPIDLTQTSQASKLKVSKIASQQAEASQLGLLAYYQLWVLSGTKKPCSRNSADTIIGVHLVTADLTDPEALTTAAKATAELTGGVVDYLIVNGAFLSEDTRALSTFSQAGITNDI